MYTHSKELPIWVVYYDTLDIPGKYCVRKFLNDKPTKEIYSADSLEEIEKYIPEGLVKLMPAPSDPKVIKEIWL